MSRKSEDFLFQVAVGVCVVLVVQWMMKPKPLTETPPPVLPRP